MCKRSLFFISLFFISIACCGQINSKLEKKAQSGNAKAQYKLARELAYRSDTAQAVFWYKQAAVQGYTDACYELAMICDKQKDYKEAAKWCEQSGGGLPWELLGRYYMKGMGVEKDFQKAAYWYEKYLNDGKPKRKSKWIFIDQSDMVSLAQCYDSLRNYTDAIRWYREVLTGELESYSARDEHAECKAVIGILRLYYFGLGVEKGTPKYIDYWLGEFRRKGGTAHYALELALEDNEMSKFWLEYAVSQGSSMAIYFMGLAYESGLLGFDNNKETAYTFYKKAAEKNYYAAYLKMAIMSEKGIGCSQNYEYAYKIYDWIINSAKEHFSNFDFYTAIGHLGIMYYNGYYVQRNPDIAYKKLSEAWYRCADSDILKTLSACYRYGQGTDTNIAEANRFEELAIKSGNADANYVRQEIDKIKETLKNSTQCY